MPSQNSGSLKLRFRRGRVGAPRLWSRRSRLPGVPLVLRSEWLFPPPPCWEPLKPEGRRSLDLSRVSVPFTVNVLFSRSFLSAPTLLDLILVLGGPWGPERLVLAFSLQTPGLAGTWPQRKRSRPSSPPDKRLRPPAPLLRGWYSSLLQNRSAHPVIPLFTRS